MRYFSQSILAGLLVLSLGACTVAGSWVPDRVEQALEERDEQSAPLIIENGHAFVPLHINQQGPYMFLLDTGASISLIDPAVRRDLGFTEDQQDTATISGIAGERDVDAIHLEAVDLAGQTVPNMRMAVLDLQGIHDSPEFWYAGVLGTDFLQHFDITYNLPEGKLQLCRYQEEETCVADVDSLNQFAFDDVEQELNLIAINIFVGDQPAKGILDTGSRTSLLNWNAAQQYGISRAEATEEYRTTGIGLGAPTQTHVSTIDRLEINGYIMSLGESSIADLPIFDLFDSPSVVLLGNDILQNRLLVIANSTGHIYLSDPLQENQPD